MSGAKAANLDQIDYWNGDAGQTWTRNQARLDRVLAPVTEAAIAAAGPKPGETALDIGCGCGDTTLALARAAGPSGRVTGVDISAPMLARAGERLIEAGLKAELIEADAATHRFAAGTFDLVFSRFGVMFFDEPAAAFANIRKGMKADARLVFACWRPLGENDWMLKPLLAALSHLAPPEPPAPRAPGPFAFAEPDYVRDLLTQAGFRDIALSPLDIDLRLAEAGKDALAEAVAFTLEIGPLARALKAEPSAEKREAATAAIRREFENHLSADGIALKGACWMVTAKA